MPTYFQNLDKRRLMITSLFLIPFLCTVPIIVNCVVIGEAGFAGFVSPISSQNAPYEVYTTIEGSVAEKVGFQLGDQITHFNGEEVNADQFEVLLTESKVGDIVELGYTRNSITSTQIFTLTEYPTAYFNSGYARWPSPLERLARCPYHTLRAGIPTFIVQKIPTDFKVIIPCLLKIRSVAHCPGLP